jgi:hypothetical protein
VISSKSEIVTARELIPEPLWFKIEDELESAWVARSLLLSGCEPNNVLDDI